MAFHQHPLGLFDRHSLMQVVRFAELVLMGPIGGEQFSEPPVGHLEDGQRLDEELRRRPRDVLELVGGSVGLENLQEHEVMDSGQIEDAQALPDRPSAKLVGCPASRLTALREVLEEDGRVVTPEPLGHRWD
jgi:hypothetical protein